ncbi:AIFM3 factor, partial [Polypterus senegalus]
MWTANTSNNRYKVMHRSRDIVMHAQVKVEVIIPEKDKEKESMSPNGKASPIAHCKTNGSAKHHSDEDKSFQQNLYRNPRDFVEATVCHVKDLENGQMREVDMPGGKVLLIKENGEYRAVSHKCPHYGAPLVKGVLSDGRVRCPWHGACFSTATGDIEDFPGLDSLAKFQVRVEKDKVIIRANKQALQSQKRMKSMAKCASLSSYSPGVTSVLIIGAGPAGLVCAETLRQEGFAERIIMCTLDRHLPYDKPKLSKSLECTVDQLTLRSKEFFHQHDIELLNEKEQLNLKGANMENIFYLRSPEDANWIAKLASNKNAVIVGASFVGMEVAAYLAEKAHSVSVIGVEDVPFKKALGEKMFENNRVKFYMLNEVSELRGQQGKLKEVVLNSGKVLRADVCVIGAGKIHFTCAVPATTFLKHSGINVDSKGFIPVTKTMQTNVSGVFAAGDVVTFPLAMRNNKKVNVPHWQMAHMQGRIAALNMLGQVTEIKNVPFFWTAMFGKSIRYAGHGEGFDDVIIQGDLDELKFVAFYTKSDEVIAVASMNYDPIVSKVAEVFRSGRAIKKRDVDMEVPRRPAGYYGPCSFYAPPCWMPWGPREGAAGRTEEFFMPYDPEVRHRKSDGLRGIGICVQPLYLGEISPRAYRGVMAMGTSIFITGGIFTGQVIGLRELLGKEDYWPILLSTICIPAILQLIFLPWFPESPRYLLIDRGDHNKCKEALKQLYGSGGFQAEEEDMERERIELIGVKPMRPWQLFSDRSLRWQLTTIIFLCAAQQLNGINAIYFYANYVFTRAGIPEDKIPYVTIGTGACECLTALTCGMLIDSLGRRILIIGGYSLMTLWCIIITLSLTYQMGLQQYCFLVFLGVCCLVATYIYFVVPETKNKTFLEIKQEFQSRYGNQKSDKTNQNRSGALLLSTDM